MTRKREAAQASVLDRNKKSKTAKLKIYEEKIVPPSEEIPPGSRFKGYRDFVMQDLVIRAHKHALSSGTLGNSRWTDTDGAATRIE